MDVGRRRGGVVTGSVWESRMKHDEFKGGIKALINNNNTTEEESETPQEIDVQNLTFPPSNDGVLHQEDVGPKPSPFGVSGKRKTWKSETSIIQIARKTSSRSDFSKSLDEEKFKDLGVKKTRSLLQKQIVKPMFCGNGDDNNSEVKKGKSENSHPPHILSSNSASSKDLDESGKSSEAVDEPKKTTFDGNKVAQVEMAKFEENKVVLVNEEKVEVKEISESSEKEKPKNIVTLDKKKLHNCNERTLPKPVPVSEESHRTPRPPSRLQGYVDLVMWRNVSKSAFVFGVGTFLIVSSSYVQDFNVSMISVLSYMGLAYLAVIFTVRSIHRGTIQVGETSDYVVGEDEAMLVVKLVLPYINEFLLNVRALFSGDPATTMKMAVLLFVLAQCGSSITIWKMAKLGLFGVFIVPKVCSSYSSQLTAFGTFWIGRFKRSWESCTHKKAIAFGIFALAWNLSSVVARIWAVFMLYVAFRYYQQKPLMREPHEETIDSTMHTNKQKKAL